MRRQPRPLRRTVALSQADVRLRDEVLAHVTNPRADAERPPDGFERLMRLAKHRRPAVSRERA